MQRFDEYELGATLGLLTPALYARLMTGETGDLAVEALAEAQAELEQAVRDGGWVRYAPAADLAAFDSGPYYLAQSGAGRPLAAPDGLLGWAEVGRYYLAARLLAQWGPARDGDVLFHYVRVGQPAIYGPQQAVIGEMPTDWHYAEPGDDSGPVLWGVLEHRAWPAERITRFLEDLDTALTGYARAYRPHLRYADYPWLYGRVTLVHTRPGEDSPAALAQVFAAWRQAVQAFEQQHGYRPIVLVAHLDRLLACPDYVHFPAYAYDLAGYC